MSDVWIVGFSTGENASTCLMKNGEVVFFIEEERLSRVKADNIPLLGMFEVEKYTDRLNYIIHTNEYGYVRAKESPYIQYFVKKGMFKPVKELKNVNIKNNNHLYHASCGFFSSGFDRAVCVVLDSGGAVISKDGCSGIERESVYLATYPNDLIQYYKRASSTDNKNIGEYFFNDGVGPAELYSRLSTSLGYSSLDCGTAMGLASYGKEDYDIPLVTEIPYEELTNYNRENLCYAVQKVSERMSLDLIMSALQITKCKNLVITGSYALNCVANYEYLKHLPEDVNLYIDPVSNDSGLGLGAAQYMNTYMNRSGSPKKLDSLYLGQVPSYDVEVPPEFKVKHVTYDDVSQLLVDGEIVAIFQGRSEAGPRALGNRSILFDPRKQNGKEVVNAIKGRESFRPFAGTVMLEHCHELFDMRGLKESPYMMFAVKVLTDKIPAITHVDGTCRIQTVTSEQNKHFYNLIKSFRDKTGVPVLFNTSFNMAGDPLVETLEDAFDTLHKSEIKYLYLPEKNILICK